MCTAAAITIHGERKREPTQTDRRLASPSLVARETFSYRARILPASETTFFQAPVYTQMPVPAASICWGGVRVRTIAIVLLISASLMAQVSPTTNPTLDLATASN